MSCPVTNRVNIEALTCAMKAQQERISTLENTIRNLNATISVAIKERQLIIRQLQTLLAKS